MAEEKTSVFVMGEDGKPKQLASFANADDAQFFARQRLTKYGRRAYVGKASNKEKMERALTPPAAGAPLQSAMDVRVASMRASVMQEQTDAAIREQAESDMKPATKASAKAADESAEKMDEQGSGETPAATPEAKEPEKAKK